MKNTIIFIVLSLLSLTFCKDHPEAKLEFEDYCKYFHYPVERHSVITEDGYILGVFRIQKRGTTIK